MAKSISKLHQKFGLKIKKLREVNNKQSQEDLAFKIGVDRSYLGFVERGERNPTLDKIDKIAKAFKIPIKDLFDF